MALSPAGHYSYARSSPRDPTAAAFYSTLYPAEHKCTVIKEPETADEVQSTAGIPSLHLICLQNRSGPLIFRPTVGLAHFLHPGSVYSRA